MDEGTWRTIREVLAAQQFGVLATLDGGRLHTSTVHFAETPELELIYVIQPATLKARQAEGNPRAAFQVDNRAVLLESRERFVRIGFEGTIRRVPEDDPQHEHLSSVFSEKLPIGGRLLANPEISLYVLRPSVVRLAVGSATPVDLSISYEEHGEPQSPADPDDAAWAVHPEAEAAPEAPNGPLTEQLPPARD